MGLFLADEILAGGFDKSLGYFDVGVVPNLLNTLLLLDGERDIALTLLTSRKQILGSLGAIMFRFFVVLY